MSQRTYVVTIEERELSTRRVLGMDFAQLSTRVIVQVESEHKPTLRALAAVLEPEP